VSQRLRIAFVVEHYHRRGGHERVVAELAERLVRSHDVHVIARDWADVRESGVTFHRVKGPERPAFAAYLQFAAASSAVAGRGRYDIVHSQGPNCLHQNIVTVHTTQRPKTAVLRSLPLFWDRLGRPRKVAWLLHQYLAIAVESRIYRAGSNRLIIALSRGIQDELLRCYGANADRITIIPNGVDLDEFNPSNRRRWRDAVRREIGLQEQDCLCLFVGGEWERKGLDVAVLALAERPTERRVVLVVVGSGLAATYEAMARDAGVGERVQFLGPRPSTAPLYAAADVFLMPSRYEAFSLVMLEAAASGLPVVATRVNGVEDFLVDGQSAFIVDGTPRSVADALSRLVSEPAAARAMGAEARRRAEEFGWEAVACRIDSLYRERLGA
jgi:glycosyltransferase involved in cell wall biosynthesis